MAVSEFERAIDIQIADMQKKLGVEVTVDLSKPVRTNREIKEESLIRQMNRKIKTSSGSVSLGLAISSVVSNTQLRKGQE